MKLKQYLDEEWKNSFQYETNGPKRTIEIFVNPTTKEMDDVSETIKNIKYIRFIAFKNKLYVFPPSVYHADADVKLKIDSFEKGHWGSAFKKGTDKWTYEGSDAHTNNPIPKFISKWIKISNKGEWSIRPREFKKINEEWKTSIKVFAQGSIKDSKTFEVFRNPTQKELDTVAKFKRVRFIAVVDPKEVLVWNPDMMHHEVAKEFGINLYGGKRMVIAGELVKGPSGWKMRDSFNYRNASEDRKRRIRKVNWRWTRKSFEGLQEYLRKEEIKEEWADTVKITNSHSKHKGETFEIFVNPTTKEINDLIYKYDDLRYIIDAPTKKFYLFSSDLLHSKAAEKLNIPYKYGDGIRMYGVILSPKSGEKLKIYPYDKLSFNEFLRKNGEKIDWVWKYFEKPKDLNEEWADSFKPKKFGDHKTQELFVNPTLKEINKVAILYKGIRYIRFLANTKNKKLYVFSPSILHYEIAKNLKLSTRPNETKDYWGTAKKEEGKWVFEGSDSHHKKPIPRFISKWIKIPESGKTTARGWSVSPYDIDAEVKEKLKLKEEWADTVKTYTRGGRAAKTVEVFKNPTQKEFNEVSIGGEIRFLAHHPTKTVYVFNPNVLHPSVAQTMGLSKSQRDYFDSSTVLGGIAKKEGNKWITFEVHNFTFGGINRRKMIVKKDWKWVNKYIRMTPYLEKMAKREGSFV